MDISAGRRFGFGRNWQRFLAVLNAERIFEAEKSLQEMLECEDLAGKSFLDIGSGSGLFSLAARRLGALVYSFDYDPRSVQCTSELKQRYFSDDRNWKIAEGSVLDSAFIKSLGAFDIVYSWGVLHHTGDMWRALDYARQAVKTGGRIFIALYNDQGLLSGFWKKIKRAYCSGSAGRVVIATLFIPCFVMYGFAKDGLSLTNPFNRYTEYKKHRGMSIYYDWIDWLGGYPFEAAKPEDVLDFFKTKDFGLVKMITTNGLGNNQFVFKKEAIV